MPVEVLNNLENMIMEDKAIIVRDAYKRYSDIISMKGLNMSVPMGSMYVFMQCNNYYDHYKLRLNV